MLHLLAQPLQQEIVERIVAGDDVVLQQGAVWAVLAGHRDNRLVSQLLALPASVHVLHDLLEVNGIDASQVLHGVGVIDYPGLVELTVNNPVIHTWC